MATVILKKYQYLTDDEHKVLKAILSDEYREARKTLNNLDIVCISELTGFSDLVKVFYCLKGLVKSEIAEEHIYPQADPYEEEYLQSRFWLLYEPNDIIL